MDRNSALRGYKGCLLRVKGLAEFGTARSIISAWVKSLENSKSPFHPGASPAGDPETGLRVRLPSGAKYLRFPGFSP